MRVAGAGMAVSSSGRIMFLAAGAAGGIALSGLLPAFAPSAEPAPRVETHAAAADPSARTAEPRLSRGSVPHLGRDAITLVPGLHLLGRTWPNAAYAIDTSEGIVLVDTCKEADAAPILDQMRALRLDPARLKAILLTHAHGDHSLGARRLREMTGARVHAGRGDVDVLRGGGPREAFFSVFAMEQPTHATEIDVPLDDGQEIRLGEARFEVLATPGHTPGSVCFLLERNGLRILFTGDTILSLSNASPLAGAGIYAAALAPRYRGRLDDFEATLRRLRDLAVPDLLLPGHPASDPQAESPQVAAWWWDRLVARGLADLADIRVRLERDGADFLDGTPREVLPGLHYWGESGGAALYGLVATSGELTLVNAPGDAALPEVVRTRAAESGLGAKAPAAVILTSCAPATVGGLRALVEATRCRVYAPGEGLAAIAAACPPGTEVLDLEALARSAEFRVEVVPVRGAASPCAALRFRWGSRVVLFTGEIPDPITIEPDSPAGRWAGRPPLRPEEVLGSLRAIESPAPDLWLPLHPLHAPNANLYGGDWARTMRHNLDCLSRPAR